MMHKAWSSIVEMSLFFEVIHHFTVTRAKKLTIWIQFEITRPVAAIKSLRFALFFKLLTVLNISSVYDLGHWHIEAETKWSPLSRQHFQMNFFNWKCISFNQNFTEFVSYGPINNISSLVQIMAYCQPGVKPLSEPIIDRLLTHVCVTQRQWVNTDCIQFCILFSLRLCNHHNLSFGSETEDREAGTKIPKYQDRLEKVGPPHWWVASRTWMTITALLCLVCQIQSTPSGLIQYHACLITDGMLAKYWLICFI